MPSKPRKAPDARMSPAMPPSEFIQIMEHKRMTADELAARLDMSRRMIQYYKLGEKRIPFLVRYALRNL